MFFVVTVLRVDLHVLYYGGSSRCAFLYCDSVRVHVLYCDSGTCMCFVL